MPFTPYKPQGTASADAGSTGVPVSPSPSAPSARPSGFKPYVKPEAPRPTATEPVAQAPTASPTPNSKEGVFSRAAAFAKDANDDMRTAWFDVIKGQAKGAGHTAVGAGELAIRAAAAVEAVPRMIYDSTIGRLTGRKSLGSGDVVEKVSEAADNARASGILTPQNKAQKFGFATEQLAEFLVPVGSAGKARAAASASKYGKAAEIASKSVMEGAESGLRTAIQEGEYNKNAKIATVIGAAAPIVEAAGEGLRKAGNYAYSTVVPMSIKERAKNIRKGIDIGERVSEFGPSITRKSLETKVASARSALGKELASTIDDFAKANPGMGYTIDDIATQVDDKLTDDVIASAVKTGPLDVDIAKKTIADRLAQYRAKYGDRVLDFNALQEIKKGLNVGLDRVLNQSLEAPVKAAALADDSVRSTLKDTIERYIPGVGQINKKLAGIIEIDDALKARSQYSGYLTDVIAGMAAAGSAGDILSDPMGYAKRAIAGVLLKRGLSSTAASTLSGELLKSTGALVKDPAFVRAMVRAGQLSVDALDGEDQPVMKR